VPPNVRYAAADLETDGLGSRLEEAGLDPATPVFVACLGVLIYLSEVAADAIFAWAARLPVDSEFVCTFSRRIPRPKARPLLDQPLPGSRPPESLGAPASSPT